MEEYKNDILKYFIQYNTNNEVIMDVSDDKTNNKFMEQLKFLINLLLHFRYMLLYVKRHYLIDLELKLKSIAEDFFSDLDFCSNQYSHLVNSTVFFDFIRKREQFYQENMDSFYSFKRDYNFHFDHDLEHSSIVGDIISVSELHLEQQNQSNNSHHNGNLEQEYSSSNQTSEMNNQTCNLQLNQSRYDDSNKDIYVNLLDLLPRQGNNCLETSFNSTVSTPTGTAKSTVKRTQKRPRTITAAKCETIETSLTKNGPIQSQSIIDEDKEYTAEMVQVEYFCSFHGCRFRAKSLPMVKMHEERRHVQQMHICSYDGCKEVFSKKVDLDSHMSHVHLCAKLKCTFNDCDQIFANEVRLRMHIKRNHKPEREGNFPCKECGKKFKTRKYMNKHFNWMHKTEKRKERTFKSKDKENKNETDSSEFTNLKDGSKKKLSKIFECSVDQCYQTFSEKSKLNQHIRENHAEEYLTCKFCDKLCRSRNSLTNHLWIMHEEGEFRCPYENCDFITKYRKHLLNHKKLRHPRQKVCPICGESITRTRFQRHMSGFHKIKNYGCSWPDCGKTFADHSALKNHVRIHLNFKRFKCKWPDCGYASEQRFTVITHIRVCHFKLPRTKKKQIEMNITQDSTQNPYDYLEVCREDICI